MVPETGDFIIYGLCEPGDITALRYIGRTSNLKSRLECHWSSQELCKRTEWIKSIRDSGQKYEVITLDRCDSHEEVILRETYLIALYRWCGFDLTNSLYPVLPGVFRHSEESKKKMSKSQTGRVTSEETKRKISLSNSGKKKPSPSDETRLKMSAGHKRYLAANPHPALGTKATPERLIRQREFQLSRFANSPGVNLGMKRLYLDTGKFTYVKPDDPRLKKG